MARKQVPFAAALSLTDAAFAFREHLVKRLWQQSFPEARNKRFPAVAFRVEKAKKRKLVSRVYDRLGRSFIDRQITGATKLPYEGSFIAVPTRHVRRTQRGVAKGMRPRTAPNTFVSTRVNGRPGIWQNVKNGKRGRRKAGAKKSGIRLLYNLEPRVKTDKALPFYTTGRRVARAAFAAAWEKNIRRATATARR